MPLKKRTYLGRDPTNTSRVFTFNAILWDVHPSQQIISACSLVEAMLPIPYLETLPRVSSYLYDEHKDIYVVSGFVLDDDSEIRIFLRHWGEPWRRWGRGRSPKEASYDG